jgi:hypothetical protein
MSFPENFHILAYKIKDSPRSIIMKECNIEYLPLNDFFYNLSAEYETKFQRDMKYVSDKINRNFQISGHDLLNHHIRDTISE